MKNLTSAAEYPDEARALARFAAVQAVVQVVQSGQSLAQACQQAAQLAWDGRFFAAATIEDWYYGYKRQKFAALQNRSRSDKGTHKALDPAAVEALLKLRREHPQLTMKVLTEDCSARVSCSRAPSARAPSNGGWRKRDWIGKACAPAPG